MQSRQAGTAYMGEYYRVTVVAMATSCASGIGWFGGQVFNAGKKKNKTDCHSSTKYFNFILKVLKNSVPTTTVISVLLVNYSISSYRQVEFLSLCC